MQLYILCYGLFAIKTDPRSHLMEVHISQLHFFHTAFCFSGGIMSSDFLTVTFCAIYLKFFLARKRKKRVECLCYHFINHKCQKFLIDILIKLQ